MFDSTTRTTPLVTTWFRWCPMMFVSINSNTTGVTTRTGSRVLIGPGLFNSLFLGFFFYKIMPKVDLEPTTPPFHNNPSHVLGWGRVEGGRETWSLLVVVCSNQMLLETLSSDWIGWDIHSKRKEFRYI